MVYVQCLNLDTGVPKMCLGSLSPPPPDLLEPELLSTQTQAETFPRLPDYMHTSCELRSMCQTFQSVLHHIHRSVKRKVDFKTGRSDRFAVLNAGVTPFSCDNVGSVMHNWHDMQSQKKNQHCYSEYCKSTNVPKRLRPTTLVILFMQISYL